MIVIVGRSGVGKDTLAKAIAKGTDDAFKILKTYTTRPKRTPSEDSHIFISPDDVEKIKGKVLVTEIDGYTYFTTLQDLKDCEICILDPKGLSELSSIYHDIIDVIYVRASEDNVIRKITERSDNNDELGVYMRRRDDEDKMLAEIEGAYKYGKLLDFIADSYGETAGLLYYFYNDFTDEGLKIAVDNILSIYWKGEFFKFTQSTD